MNVATFIQPETREGEVFFSNMTAQQFELFDWVSKRKGSVSYDGYGNRLDEPNWFPVFVTTKEIAERKTDLTRERWEWKTLVGLYTTPRNHRR